MVDTILQWLHEQRDTHVVTIRSAKLSINVLLVHWHHVRTTDTVIVVSSYSKFLVSFVILSFHERKPLPSCVLAPTDIFRGVRDRISDHDLIFCASKLTLPRFVKAKFVASFDHFAFLPPSLTRSKVTFADRI